MITKEMNNELKRFDRLYITHRVVKFLVLFKMK